MEVVVSLFDFCPFPSSSKEEEMRVRLWDWTHSYTLNNCNCGCAHDLYVAGLLLKLLVGKK